MIRQMTRADLPDIMRIWIEGNLDAHSFVDGDYWRQNYTAVQREMQRAEVYVCEENGEVVGFVGLKGDYIAGLFVDREYRGRGVGKQLLDRAKKTHRELSLHVFEKNPRALRFYLREGFAQT
ncbi:MAG: GNAT family N-acetyltransferase, partial [Oscillospiraceae bacterium]